MTFYSFFIIFTCVFFITYFLYKKKQKEMFASLRINSITHENTLPTINPYKKISKDKILQKNKNSWSSHVMYGYSFIHPKYWKDDREPICHVKGPSPAPVFDKGTPDNALFYQRPITIPKKNNIKFANKKSH